jgi:hypothetical protein
MTATDFTLETHAAESREDAIAVCRVAGIMPTMVVWYTSTTQPRRVTCPECKRILRLEREEARRDAALFAEAAEMRANGAGWAA